MTKPHLAGALLVAALVATACGTASSSTNALHPGEGGSPRGSVSTPLSTVTFPVQLLRRVQVPAGAIASPRAPSRALARVPGWGSPASSARVARRYWAVKASAAAVYAWLGRHDSALGPASTVRTATSGDLPIDPIWPSAQYRVYQPRALPASIAVAQLYVGVAATGPGRSAIAASVVTLAQPPRPVREVVPTSGVRARIGWSLAAGGTPVRKTLTGSPAVALARAFDALTVRTSGAEPCPLVPEARADIIVTFAADGSTWTVDIPACPAITVTRDGRSLPALDFDRPFLDEVRAHTGYLPSDGPPAGGGDVTPLGVVPPAG